jgi:hypothetical protein
MIFSYQFDIGFIAEIRIARILHIKSGFCILYIVYIHVIFYVLFTWRRIFFDDNLSDPILGTGLHCRPLQSSNHKQAAPVLRPPTGAFYVVSRVPGGYAVKFRLRLFPSGCESSHRVHLISSVNELCRVFRNVKEGG